MLEMRIEGERLAQAASMHHLEAHSVGPTPALVLVGPNPSIDRGSRDILVHPCDVRAGWCEHTIQKSEATPYASASDDQGMALGENETGGGEGPAGVS